MDRRTIIKDLGAAAASVARPAIGRALPDVTVVGAGAFGDWTALCLRERGADVLLLDSSGAGNGLHIIDTHPAWSNVWIAGGCSGHGVRMGPVTGEHLADRVLGVADPGQVKALLAISAHKPIRPLVSSGQATYTDAENRHDDELRVGSARARDQTGDVMAGRHVPCGAAAGGDG